MIVSLEKQWIGQRFTLPASIFIINNAACIQTVIKNVKWMSVNLKFFEGALEKVERTYQCNAEFTLWV